MYTRRQPAGEHAGLRGPGRDGVAALEPRALAGMGALLDTSQRVAALGALGSRLNASPAAAAQRRWSSVLARRAGAPPRGPHAAVQLTPEDNRRWRDERLDALFTQELLQEQRQSLRAKLASVNASHPGVLADVDPAAVIGELLQKLRTGLSNDMGKDDVLALGEAEYRAAFNAAFEERRARAQIPSAEVIAARLPTLAQAREAGLDLNAVLAVAPEVVFQKLVVARLEQRRQELREQAEKAWAQAEAAKPQSSPAAGSSVAVTATPGATDTAFGNLAVQTGALLRIMRFMDEGRFAADLVAAWGGGTPSTASMASAGSAASAGSGTTGALHQYAREIYHQTIGRATRHLQSIPIDQPAQDYGARVQAFMDGELPILFRPFGGAPRTLDTTSYSARPGSEPASAGALQEHLARYKPAYIGFNTGDEKLCAMRAIAGLNFHRGMERRLVAEMGAERLLIRLYDTGGGFAVELLSRNPPGVARGEALPVEASKKMLAERYGLGAFEETPAKPWTAGDLERLADALARVPADDLSALRGLRFARVGALASASSTTHTSGRFHAAEGVRRIELTDRALADKQLFSLPGPQNAVPSGQRTILHEIGHAVEHQAKLDAQDALNRKIDAYNLIVPEEKAAVEAFKLLVGTQRVNSEQATKTTTSFAERLAAFGKAASASFVASDTGVAASVNAFIGASNAAVDLYDALHKNADADGAAFAAAHAATAAVAKPQPVLASALDALGLLLQEFRENRLKRREIDRKLEERGPQVAAIQERLAAAQAELGQAQAAHAGASAGSTSKRLADFAAFCAQHKIAPHATDYAAKSAAAGNLGEFFADSYSLFLTDPDFLKLNYPMVFHYFSRGMHRQ